jgi:ATP/maltotriose-dependent transcriptional regulator MalT
MSVADQFEQDLVSRLRELRPLAVEYQQLEKVARRLGLAPDDDRAAPSRGRTASISGNQPQRTSTTSPPAAPSRKASAQPPRAPLSGATAQRKHEKTRTARREQEVLRLVQDRPGMTVRQIADELNVDATNLYRHVRKLEEEGSITKRGTGLHPQTC